MQRPETGVSPSPLHDALHVASRTQRCFTPQELRLMAEVNKFGNNQGIFYAIAFFIVGGLRKFFPPTFCSPSGTKGGGHAQYAPGAAADGGRQLLHVPQWEVQALPPRPSGPLRP